MARTKNSFIKDLRYDKWFAVGFEYYNKTFVYCKPKGIWNFICLQSLTTIEKENIHIKKCKDQEEADRIIRSIPDFEFYEDSVYLEAIPYYKIEEWL